MSQLPSRLVFYDGVCAMCNGIVKWMLRIDTAGMFRFASLQSETADQARKAHPGIPSELETMVYLRDGEVFLRSRGAFEAMREVSYPWKALSWLRVFPVWLTDFFYGILAKYRYRVFGKYDQCPLPPPEDRARFLP
ncbi:MAG: DCC1-like thiol-disulfide oxidoreductase family protein [Myxococcales bacterium]|nr:DCC1-like thiol-disulfide oxidoreductase family protein [Myxococcales bacterium]MDH3844531.1 DCC1-like thiol-disulfide oxidoreductase family protein [Myxococcales bacterium]